MSTWVAIRTIRPGPRASSRCKARRIAGSVITGSGTPFFPGRTGSRCARTLLQRQEAVGQHHQAGVVVEPPPRPALEVVQAQLLLHLLVALLHRPAALPQPDRLDPARVRRQVAEGVLDLAVGLLLDQQPDRLGPGALARSPSPGPARPAARRTGPTAAPWSPPARSPSAAASAPPAPSGSPAGASPRPAGAASAGGRPVAAAGATQRGSSVKTTISSVTPTM